MKKTLHILAAAAAVSCAAACSDDLEVVIPDPGIITMDDLEIPGRFSHVIPGKPFSTGGITFNSVKEGNQLGAGFCYSNRSMRWFNWLDTEESVDSIRYSVMTAKPNNTGTYLVCRVQGDEAYFTLDAPRTIDYMIINNTTWDWCAMFYGPSYTGKSYYLPVTINSTWYSRAPGVTRKFGNGDYYTVKATGYLAGRCTGEISYDLACKTGHNADNPAWNYVAFEWRSWDFTPLGTVDKVVFHVECSIPEIPPFFCLDGICLAR